MSINSDRKLNNFSSLLSKVIGKKKDVNRQAQSQEDIVNLLMLLLNEVSTVGKINKAEFTEAIKSIKVQSNVTVPKIEIPSINVPEASVKVDIPEIKLPDIHIPEIKLPNISIPEISVPKIPKITIPPIKIPKIDVPDVIMPKEMDIRGWVQLQGVDLNNPLPVQIRDANGKPINFGALAGSGGGGGGGGGISSLKNKSSEKINPATEEKQDDIITAIEANKITAKTPNEYNITLTVVDTEYSQALPVNTKSVQFTNRSYNDLRYSFTAGRVATPTAPYLTLKAGETYFENNLDFDGKTIYFANDDAGDVVELLVIT